MNRKRRAPLWNVRELGPHASNLTLLGVEFNTIPQEGEQADIRSSGRKQSILDRICTDALETCRSSVKRYYYSMWTETPLLHGITMKSHSYLRMMSFRRDTGSHFVRSLSTVILNSDWPESSCIGSRAGSSAGSSTHTCVNRP